MAKLAITGHSASDLIDCSEVIPTPKPPVGKPATFPATQTAADLEQACPSPFPVLSADRTFYFFTEEVVVADYKLYI